MPPLVAGVSWPTPPASAPSLDVVLVSRPAATPEQASAIATAAQQAASVEAPQGTPPAPAAEATPETPEPPATRPTEEPSDRAAAPSPDAAPEPSSAPSSEPSPASSPEAAPAPSAPAEPATEPTREPANAPEAPALSGRELAASATASLREQDFAMSEQAAPLADQEQQAAREAAEARYVDAWTRRVQDYGNRFYPAPPALDGQLRVRVVIDHQGKLLQAEVVQSSGHPELDQAALDTIRGAAPYRPFDSGMAGLDRLSISRVWRFGTGNEFGVR